MKKEVISVSQLTNKISRVLDKEFDSLSVQGEISNLTNHRSGHRYFTLKDDNAQISCVMWRSRRLNFELKEGMKAIVSGKLSVFAPRGSYQIDVTSIKPEGQGDLYLAFEALKEKLEEKGYFDLENKLSIPELPMNVGVSTSPTGAAIKDIISTFERRLPILNVYFVPTVVQGDGASKSIVKAIEILNSYPLDVIIIGRGGGSIEDLWAYNEEETAEAIYNSEIPIVSAVGHETDYTIADFVADFRAPTPTGAAELITPITISDLYKNLKHLEEEIKDSVLENHFSYSRNIDELINSYSFRSVNDRILNSIHLCDEFDNKSKMIIKNNLNFLNNSVISLTNHCRALNPQKPLEKGYALLLSGSKQIANNESLGNYITLNIKRLYETAEVSVNKIHKNK